MDVDEDGRIVEEVTGRLRNMGLELSAADDYEKYTGELKCRKS